MIKGYQSPNFCVYGDSIAYGYGSDNISWFDLLRKNRSISGNKLAQNGEKIADVLQKISQDTNIYNYIFLAVGINDLLQSSDVVEVFDATELLVKYDKILSIAITKSKNLVVQSLLPVRENLFPNQNWLDCPKWVLNANVVKFNNGLQNLVKRYDAIYIDAYAEFASQALDDLYIDAVHLNEKGQTKLFEIYDKVFREIKL